MFMGVWSSESLFVPKEDKCCVLSSVYSILLYKVPDSVFNIYISVCRAVGSTRGSMYLQSG